MALTVEAAEQAGTIAAAIRAADYAIEGLNARIGEGAQIVAMVAQLSTGNSIRAEVPMTVEDSAAVFNAVLSIVQAKRDALAAMLTAL